MSSHAQTEQASSSTDTTPVSTPTQEHPALTPEQRGRPRYKRQTAPRRYFTPPSRFPSPARPDFVLEVETAPQDPDIFADAEPDTDYFSSTEKHDGPRAYRRHFFDALPSVDGKAGKGGVGGGVRSIDEQLASK